jgi:hypothetical protein
MTQPLIDEATLNELINLAQTLYAALDNGDPTQIINAQQALSAGAAQAWERLEQEPIAARDKAVARLLAEMAIHTLPQTIQDPANYPSIQHELRLLKNSLVLLR